MYPAMKANLGSAWLVFKVFLRLGLSSFGGPIAHIAYFREEFVVRRGWISEQQYADLVALCQFLPGPASSQVVMALGLFRAGYSGVLAAWVGFTLPSALGLMLFAYGLTHIEEMQGVLHGLKVLAVAVVMQALWDMGRKFCSDSLRISLMVGAACMTLYAPFAGVHMLIILLAGVVGSLWCSAEPKRIQPLEVPVSPRMGLVFLLVFVLLLVGLPLAHRLWDLPALAWLDTFYRVGSLVFGGGHVVLPLLHTEVVSSGWISEQSFLAGYSATQAVPGPLFSFAAFLGVLLGGWPAGLLCLVGLFLPAFLVVMGALPFWALWCKNPRMQSGLAGINAAVVGLLLAALYQPLWQSTITSKQDFALVLITLLAVMCWRWPLWVSVLGCALVGGLAY